MLAAGGAAALVAPVALSHALDAGSPLLPDPAALVGYEPADSTITQVATTSLLSGTSSNGLEPVRLAEESQQADAAKLAKAAGLAEAAAAEVQRAKTAAIARRADLPSVRGAKCAPNRSGFGAVKSWVSTSGSELRCIFGVGSVGGVASRSGVSDHPRGLALDFMVDRATGDDLAAYALEYQDELKIKYVIWRQRINFGNGWRGMGDRGSATANHYDHVHISFNSR